MYDETKFEQHVGQGRWLVMPCAPGTAFNPVDCQCSLTLVKVPGKVRQGMLNREYSRLIVQSFYHYFGLTANFSGSLILVCL